VISPISRENCVRRLSDSETDPVGIVSWGAWLIIDWDWERQTNAAGFRVV